MMLPFSNALDDAPNHLYVIYQASIAFFAALIAFQVLFRQTNSTFDVFIKAIDGHLAKSDENKKEGSTADHGKIELKNRAEDHTKTGMELSETEKDTVLAKVVLSYLNKGIDFTEEIDLVFQQRDSSPQSNAGGCQECFSRCRKKKESNSSSAQLKAGGDSLQVEKQKGENDSDSNAAGCFSRCRKNKEKQQGDHGSQQPKADGHSPKVKGKDQHGNSDLAHSSAGGCFSCCCRKTEQSLLKEEH